MNVPPEPGRPYVCGRPPYGYQVTDKQLHIHPEQSKAVLRIFEMVRAGKDISFVVEAMQARDEDSGNVVVKVIPGTDKRKSKTIVKAPFWDRKKVARILTHAPLYCTGEYLVQGQNLRLPQLVFLNPRWVNTPGAPPVVKPKRRVPRLAASDTMTATRS